MQKKSYIFYDFKVEYDLNRDRLQVSWDQNIIVSAFQILHISDFFWATCSPCIHPWIEIHSPPKAVDLWLSPVPKSHQRSDTKHNESIQKSIFKGKVPQFLVFKAEKMLILNEKWDCWNKWLVFCTSINNFRLTESPESIAGMEIVNSVTKASVWSDGCLWLLSREKMIVWHHRPQKPQLLKHEQIKHHCKGLCTKIIKISTPHKNYVIS